LSRYEPGPSLTGDWGAADRPDRDDVFAPEYYDGVVLRRALAYLLDICFIIGLSVAFWVGLWILTIVSFGLLSPLWLAFPLLALAYHTVLIGGPHSATLGMRMTGVEVRSWTGGRPSYLQAALQTILFYSSLALTSSLILLVVFFNRRHRALHDYLAGTTVIRSMPARPTLFGP
jgi:uncharacterized RDD family membrane protein YckC